MESCSSVWQKDTFTMYKEKGLEWFQANYLLYLLEYSWFESRSWEGVLDTTLCDEVCQGLAAGRWFSPGTLVSSTNKTDHHDITEILLKVVLNTITLTLNIIYSIYQLYSNKYNK
jgi:hypothetical protein